MKRLRNITRAFTRNEHGAVAAEAAVILPVLIMLGLGAIDYSNMLYQHHTMETSLTSAGEYLAQSRMPQNYEAQARNLAVTGQISGGQAKLPNWAASDIKITYTNIANTSGAYRGGSNVKVVKLSSDLAYSGFGLVNAITPGTVTLNAEYQERVMGQGT